MSDDTTCVCGFEAKNSRGLSAHQRACDEYQAEDEEEEDGACDYSDFEKQVLERDDNECVNCGTEEELVVHQVHPERSESKLANHKTLCEECDEELSGFNHRTKRTLIRNE